MEQRFNPEATQKLLERINATKGDMSTPERRSDVVSAITSTLNEKTVIFTLRHGLVTGDPYCNRCTGRVLGISTTEVGSVSKESLSMVSVRYRNGKFFGNF